MPEVTPDATLIIATSWQALGRAETGDQRATICNCAVIIVFAAFYIEANLNHFIEKAASIEGLPPAPDEYAGLQKKLGWLYNSFIAKEPIAEVHELESKLEEEFPGFQAIRNFRNRVSHGYIDRSTATLEVARQLRKAAKAIVKRIIEVGRERGLTIEAGVEYEMAIITSDAAA
jgi:hypothetical protein